MSVPWLADELRAAGVTVVEHSGWKTHDRPGTWEPRFIVVHATAAPRSQADDVQVRVVRDGRSDLQGPIANACIDRLGRWHVLSAGRCNTTIAGTAGPFDGLGNTYALGIEACNDNGLASPAEQWPDVQYDAYVRGVAAICRRMGWPASRAVGHKEHTPGHKTDPTFSMTTFRSRVAAAIEGDDMEVSDLNAALRDSDGDLAVISKAIPWQYTGGGIPAGMSTLSVLSGTYATAQAIKSAITSNAAAEAQRDAAQNATLAGITTALQALAAATGALTPEQLAELTEQVRQAATEAGQQATAAVTAKLDSLREHLGDDVL